MKLDTKILLTLFLLFVFSNTVYLHRVPGLFGDEASEGDNVFQMLSSEKIVVVGERSYVGPLVDYARLPLIVSLGYSALTLRILMWLVSMATFGLAVVVFGRLFGRRAALMVVAVVFFSPIYLLYQRLGWAITLFPFWGLLLLFFLTDRRLSVPYRSALAGLVAGLGLHNYILFLPIIVGVAVPWLLALLFGSASTADGARHAFVGRLRELGGWWLAVVGFWAGFGTQFAVIQLRAEDQGDPALVLQQFGERLGDLASLLPLIVSGSSYVARYTGTAFSGSTVAGLVLVLVGLAVVAVAFSARRTVALLWGVGAVLHMLALTLIIDRFTLRYFVVSALSLWVLAGLGLYCVSKRFAWTPIVVALLLLLWTGSTTLVPYLRSGGSTERFSLGNRTDTAADFVDIRSLVACAQEAGPVWSDNPHIYNRLLFLSRDDQGIILPESKFDAHWVVDYRLPGEPPGTRCSDLQHFRVTKRK